MAKNPTKDKYSSIPRTGLRYPKVVYTPPGTQSYYDPHEETIYAAAGENPSVMQHEMFHHWQNLNKDLQVGPVRDVPITAENPAEYYNRRQADMQDASNKFLKRNPSFLNIPLNLLYNKEVEPSMYYYPEYAEGEAEEYENYVQRGGQSVFPEYAKGGPVYNWIPEYPRTGAKYAKGGWLEKYADGSVVDIIKGSYINPFNWGVSDYSNVKNFSKAYEQAKKAGEEEFLWNGKRYNTKYAGTPRQEVGAYGVQGKPVNTKYINDPAQVNLYPPFGKYLPGHIAASIGDNQTAVDYRPKGNLPYGLDKVKNKGEKSFNVYGQDNLTFSNKAASLPTGDYMLEDEYRPSDWNLFTNNCADNVCDAFGIPRSKGIQTPKGAMQKIQEKYPTLDVTGRTYEDYYDLSKKTSAIANMGTSAERKKLLTNYNNLIGIASSPDLESTKVSKNFGTALQVALKKEGYDLSNSIKSNGNFDGVIGPETLNALKDWESKNAVNKKANGGTIEDQRIPTPTTPSYYPDYPDRTLTNYQMGTPKAPMYAAGSTVWTKQTTPSWVAGTPTPTTTQKEINPSRTHSPGTAMPYPEIKITGPTNPYMPASPPVLQGYNPYNGPMRLHAPTTTKMAKHGGEVTEEYEKRAGIPYAINPGISDAGMYVGPTTQRGITFRNGGDVPPYVTSDPKEYARRQQAYKDSAYIAAKYPIERGFIFNALLPEVQTLITQDPKWKKLYTNFDEAAQIAVKNKMYPVGAREVYPIEWINLGNGAGGSKRTFVYAKPKQKVIFNPLVTKIPMRGMPSVSTEEAMPQKVNVPKTNLLPAQYMDTRGEWSNKPQVPPGYTEEQLLKMGYRAPQKKANGGWLDSYNDGGEVDLNKPYLNPATVQSVLAKANQPVTTTTGRVISTPASREKERREKIIAKDPSKYSVEDYKKGIQEPGADNSVLSDPLAMAAALTAGGVGLGAYGLSQVPRMFLGNLASEATAGLTDLKKLFTKRTPFKSEIDWAKWNKETPNYPELINEYNAIEKATKKAGTWMKYSDGTSFDGTPEQFIQMNSSNLQKFAGGKKAAEEMYKKKLYRGAHQHIDDFTDNSIFKRKGFATFLTDSKKNAETYATSDGNFKPYFHPDINLSSDFNKRWTDGIYELAIPRNLPRVIGEAEGRKWRLLNYDKNIAEGVEDKKFLKDFQENLKNNAVSLYNLDDYNPSKEYLSTDLYADYVMNPNNLEGIAQIKNVKDQMGFATDIPANTVYAINANKVPIKSLRHNVGFFDMTNPNIYKAVIPGAIIGAGALQQSNQKKNGGWLDSYEEGGEVDPITGLPKPYLNPAMVQATLKSANENVYNTLGQLVSTPQSREKARREKVIAKNPSKYSVEDYKQGIKEPNLEDATLEAIDALSMLSGAGYLGKKGVELGVKGIAKGVKNLVYKGVDPMFYNPTEKIKSFVPNLLSTEKDKIKRVEKIMRDSGVRGSYRKAQNRLDAWRVGLGLPQKYNTFKEIGENTFTINPKFFTLNPEIQQSIIAHAKAFNLKDKYLNNVITSEQYEKGLVNINKKMHNRLGDTFYGKYVKEENIPFQPKAIVERKGDKGFSMYDQDRYAGVMGGFRWDIEDLPDNKIKLIARDTWDLYPFEKRGATKFSDLTSLKRQKELNKGYIPALKNVEMLKLVGGKPYNIENTFIVDKYKQGGWLDNL